MAASVLGRTFIAEVPGSAYTEMPHTNRNIVIIQGHPDADSEHYSHALAQAYAEAATASGHEVRRIDVAKLRFDFLRSQKEWGDGPVPADVRVAQETIAWANHLVIIYPLWLGTMPAMLKAFFEQVFRPGFAMDLEPVAAGAAA